MHSVMQGREVIQKEQSEKPRQSNNGLRRSVTGFSSDSLPVAIYGLWHQAMAARAKRNLKPSTTVSFAVFKN